VSDCADALAALERQGIEAWRGLPFGCPPDSLAPAITDLDPSPGMADLGLQKAFFRSGVLAAADAEAQVWTTTDETEVLMVALANPPFLTTGAAALERLGEPDARLDSARGTVPLAASEWVYPTLGLAVFADPNTDAVWRLTLFRPCSLDDYEDEFRVSLLERRLPRH
jgi:hypothetical protein